MGDIEQQILGLPLISSRTGQDKTRTYKQRVLSLWLYQWLLILFMAIVVWLLQPSMTLSVLAGALIYWLPNAYFTLYAFRFRGAQAAVLILRSMYRGEFGKLMLTAIGFSMAFVFLSPIYPFAIFIAFFIMTLSQWVLVSRW